MNSKYNVLVKYLGEGEFKFTIKKLGEVSIMKNKPIYIYNADVDTINNLRTLRRMLIEITIGSKPTGAYKVYNMDELNKEQEFLSRNTNIDRRNVEAVSENDVKSILSSGSNGPIILDTGEAKAKVEEKPVKKPKTTTKKTTKKTSKK